MKNFSKYYKREILEKRFLKYELDFDDELKTSELRKIFWLFLLEHYDFFEDEKYSIFKSNTSYWKSLDIEFLRLKCQKEFLVFYNESSKRYLSIILALRYLLDFENLEYSKQTKKHYTNIKKNLKKRFKIEKRDKFFSILKDKKNLSQNLNDYFSQYKFGIKQIENIIEFENVQKFYGNKNHIEHVLKDVNLKIPKGATVSILGPSGSGKSTLINLISGLIVSEDGSTIVASRNLSFFNEKQRTKFREENISFVFQSYNLLNTLNSKDNILLGYDLLADKTKALNFDEIIHDLGIEDKTHKYPYQLSGGQKQRVAIARAIIKNPKILLADEPTGALDVKTAREVLMIFSDIAKKHGTTILIVTHDQNIALTSDYILKIKNGRIISFEKNLNKICAKDLRYNY